MTDFRGTVWAGGPYGSFWDNLLETICLSYGCYSLTVNDSYGDGFCCCLRPEIEQLILRRHVCWFQVGSLDCDECRFLSRSSVCGWLHRPLAVNYNPLATLDDGSCIAAIPGCTNEATCNYDPAANPEDGSCTFPEQYYRLCGRVHVRCRWRRHVCDALEVVGCTDATACNYDENATELGACFFPDGFNCDGTSLCLEDLNQNSAVDVGDVLLSRLG